MSPAGIALIGLLSTLLGASIAVIAQGAIAWSQERNKFRLAALDERLKAHQDAFTLSREMIKFTGQQDRQEFNEAAAKWRKWWTEHCLFLDQESMNEFIACVGMLESHQISLSIQPQDQGEIVGRVLRLGKIIATSAGLPRIAN